MSEKQLLHIGLMSGTSLDGVDGVLAFFSTDDNKPGTTLASAYVPFPDALRTDLMTLQSSGENEIHREAAAANEIAKRYVECVSTLLEKAGVRAEEVASIGAHGQTIRHRPDCGYTRQTNNPALLAELSGIGVVADFRSRDIAAGGQGAPLVPAFHHAVFGVPDEIRAVVNIGGIANISVLAADRVSGFDTGPGNVLMDAWIAEHHGHAYDKDGTWASTGAMIPRLLDALRSDPYFSLAPPKSTGRDLFNPDWLQERLAIFKDAAPEDVQATLCTFTATTIADAITKHASQAKKIFVCGGGAYNGHLMRKLRASLDATSCRASLETTDALGVSPNHVEALAFAWLAHRHLMRRPGNLPTVTGAKGPRILGAFYPA